MKVLFANAWTLAGILDGKLNFKSNQYPDEHCLIPAVKLVDKSTNVSKILIVEGEEIIERPIIAKRKQAGR